MWTGEDSNPRRHSQLIYSQPRLTNFGTRPGRRRTGPDGGPGAAETLPATLAPAVEVGSRRRAGRVTWATRPAPAQLLVAAKAAATSSQTSRSCWPTAGSLVFFASPAFFVARQNRSLSSGTLARCSGLK
jgi:hypothetical protein